MQKRNTNYVYQSGLDKACFQLAMTYAKYKDLIEKTQSDKVLRDKVFKIADNPKYDGYQRGLVSVAFKIFDEKSEGSGVVRLQINLLSNLCQTSYNLQMNFINDLLEIFKKEGFILHLKTIFGVQIYLICN